MLEVWCGDCLNLMERICDNSIDMILCDLPYGCTRNTWDTQLPMDLLWSEYIRIAKPHCPIILFASGMFTAQLMMSKPDLWRYNLIWEKSTPTGFLNAKRMPLRAHEDICVFYKRLPIYNPQMEKGRRKVSSRKHKRNCSHGSSYGEYANVSYDSSDRYPKSVLHYSTDKQTCSLHPTQKPVNLCEWLIKTYSNEGDVILDNCMGSGTTGVACLNTRRSFLGIEKDYEIFTTATKRLKDKLEASESNELLAEVVTHA